MFIKALPALLITTMPSLSLSRYYVVALSIIVLALFATTTTALSSPSLHPCSLDSDCPLGERCSSTPLVNGRRLFGGVGKTTTKKKTTTPTGTCVAIATTHPVTPSPTPVATQRLKSSCPPTQSPHSDHSIPGSISGFVQDSVTVMCDEGYHIGNDSGNNYTQFYCLLNQTWYPPVGCEANKVSLETAVVSIN